MSITQSTYAPTLSVFSQLLANENLQVAVGNIQTPQFDTKHRIITLPHWQDYSADAWVLFAAHEVGHALYTPQSFAQHPGVCALYAQYPQQVVLCVLNILEDVRIERLLQTRYPGLSKTFARGYLSLLDANFFGKSGSDIAATWPSYGMIDRLNLFAKVGKILSLSLDLEQERGIMNRATATDTFDAVVDLTKDVLQHLSESFATQNIDGCSIVSETLRAAEIHQQARMPSPGSDPYVLPRISADMRGNDVSFETYIEYTPRSFQYIEREFASVKRAQAPTLTAMVELFRANQAAQESRHAESARSGRLDPTRLAQYRIMENVFLRREFIAKGKNHGLMLVVDLSTSMKSTLDIVFWQILHLIWLAERLHIPVEVWGFTTSGENCLGMDATPIPYRSRRLVCLFTSSATAAQRTKAQVMLLWLVSQHITSGSKRLFPPAITIKMNTNESHRYVQLGETPLYSAIQKMVATTREFRERCRLEQCVCVWLTDGGDTEGLVDVNLNVRRDPSCIIDPSTGRTYTTSNGVLPALFSLFREKTGATTVSVDISEDLYTSTMRIGICPSFSERETFTANARSVLIKHTHPKLPVDALIVTHPSWWKGCFSFNAQNQISKVIWQEGRFRSHPNFVVGKIQSSVVGAGMLKFSSVLVPILARGRRYDAERC